MSPRMLTSPPTDRRMWRRLLATVHPDRDGDHELFIWIQALQEYVAGDSVEDVSEATTYERRQPPTHPKTAERVPYEDAFGRAGSFAELTRQALMFADEVGEPYASLLRLLADCYEATEADAVSCRGQHQGATYKQLAYIAHLAGMSPPERTRWYRVCERIPMSQRHAGHILSRLQERAA